MFLQLWRSPIGSQCRPGPPRPTSTGALCVATPVGCQHNKESWELGLSEPLHPLPLPMPAADDGKK